MKQSAQLTLLLLILVVILSIACSFSTAGNDAETQIDKNTPISVTNAPENTQEMPTAQNTPVHSKPVPVNPQSANSEFPLPDGASNLTDLGNGQINFQVSGKMQDVMDFYRQKFSEQGLKERELLTVTSETTFSMVFDGAANGQSIVVQGVVLSENTLNINIRYEKV